ncbi:MAG: transposase [Hormoscilla sp. SP12CHS1]|nr:transposase [Hormoscilla sp. SP12CHS1]
MARQIYKSLKPGEVVLADALYGNKVDLALVQSQGADGVFRKNHHRKTDFRRGQKLGIGDRIVTWTKPKKAPNHISAQEWASLLDTLQVREVHLAILKPGFRPKQIILFTTLLDPKRYRKARLAELYQRRWETEVDIKHIFHNFGYGDAAGQNSSNGA